MGPNIKDQMDQMFAKFGQKPPDLGGMMGGMGGLGSMMGSFGQKPAPAVDTGDLQVQAPTGPKDEVDVISGGEAPQRAPQFRDQKNTHDAEVAQIEQVINGLEKAQENDRHANSSERIRELGARAGQAASSGIAHLPITETGPLTPKISQADQKLQSAKLKEGMKQDLFKRENPELERQHKMSIAEYQALMKDLEEKQKEAHADETELKKEGFKTDERKQHEAFSADQGDKNRAAGLTRPVVAAAASAGTQGSRQDAEFANQQAERQLVGRTDLTPHSATDKSTQSVTDGALRGVERVGGQAIDIMRKYGRNFPQSTEWQKLESTMMNINQQVNHLHHNGVMNFNDKDNNVQEIGDAQSLKQFIINNGPDVLEHAIKNMHTAADADAMAHGYGPLDDKNWKAKSAKDFIGQSSGGGTSKSGPLQDPNTLPAIINSVNKGTPMPQLRDGQAKQPSSDDVNKLPERRDPNKGRTITWSPGQKAKVVE